MSDYSFYLLMAAVVIGAALIFAPTRAILGAIFGDKGILHPLWSLVSAVGRAHVVVVKNFAPRTIIYPTLENKARTNRED